MHAILKEIPSRILKTATAALTQANQHSALYGQGVEHWPEISVINAAHAGELFLKAVIASQHPLLIFKDLFHLDGAETELDIEHLLKKGRSYDLEKLPQILWVVTGQRIADQKSFDELRVARNAVQHFCAPPDVDLSTLSLNFIYKVIDPLILQNFGIYALNYHEDGCVGYGYIVSALLTRGIKFSVPDNFSISEYKVEEFIFHNSEYRMWFQSEMRRIGRGSIYSQNG